MTAFLWHVGWSEIDGDAAGRKRKPGGNERGPHALLGFGDRLVLQTDYVESGQTGRDLHLHVDRAGLDPLKGYGRNPRNHAVPHHSIKGSGEPWGKSRTFREQDGRF